jgi:membrane protease YdiL (CAAX protease family)
LRKYNVSNKDLLMFLVITFGLTALMCFAMSIIYPTNSVGAFPLVQMFYPALGVMGALLLNKNSRNNVPKKFFITFIAFATLSIAYILIRLFVFKLDPESDLGIILFITSWSLIVAYSSDKREMTEEFGLSFGKNFKVSFRYIGLFILLYLLGLLISSLVQGDFKGFITPFITPEKWGRVFLLPLSFLFSYPVFLGEEYGWRYFLQPALQERLGKRKGILLLGLIWGIWHLPINIFYYSPETSLYSVLNQLIICTGYSIFFGYVYMKTENVWTISIIHFLNNNLGAVLYGGTGENLVFSWQAILFNLVLFSIIYGPFLLTGSYKSSTAMEDKRTE